MFQLLVTYSEVRTQSLNNASTCQGTTFVPSDLLFGASEPTDNNLYRYVMRNAGRSIHVVFERCMLFQAWCKHRRIR